MTDVTQILSAIEQGDPTAPERLLPLLYEELCNLAHHNLAREKPGQTLQTTALVHEAYVRLVDVDVAQHWNSRGHFFAAAAEAMRRILIENARRKKQIGRGGDMQRVPLEGLQVATDVPPEELLALDESLCRLEHHDPLAAKLVKLRYFAGMTVTEVAETLGISRRTAERNWTYARTWLHRDMS